MTDPNAPHRDPSTPSFEHYEVVERIGGGGMASVYRARDRRMNRMVAIKVLHRPIAPNSKEAERFRKEIQLAAALRHPNVVVVHDCSPVDAERCYVVTELATGGSLRDHLERRGTPDGRPRPMVPEEAALLLLPVASALAAAHGQGIVHRDVKPDNILIDRGEVTAIKLSDFGVALTAGDPRITTDGHISGSLPYIAPEQLRDGEVAATADVWAFGVTLYELIAGTRPVRGRNLGHLVNKILAYDPPASFPFEELLSPEMKALLRRCLQQDPVKRYPNGAELFTAVGRALSAAGIDHPERELQQWVADARYAETLRHRIADRLVSQAARVPLADRVELLDRALALVPDHQGAIATLGRTGAPAGARRRRWPLIGVVLTLVAGAVALVLATRSGEPDRRRPARDHPAADGAVANGAVADRAPKPDDERRPSIAPDAAVVVAPPYLLKRPRGVTARPAARRPAVLRLTTEPWAEVFVDGRRLGHTPKVSRIELRPGWRRILLKNPLCKPRELRVRARPGQRLERHVKLEVLPARVELRAPPGWTVFVDGRRVGVAPLKAMKLAHGSHRVRIVSPAGKQRLSKVSATAGRLVVLDLSDSQ